MKLADSSDSNVDELVTQLRYEKIFIFAERTSIKKLNELVQTKADEVLESLWVSIKQKLILLTQRDITPEIHQQLQLIKKSKYIEAKNLIGYQNAIKFGNILQILRTKPQELAMCLIHGESGDDSHQYKSMLQSVVTGLYASFIFPEDTKYSLVLLYELFKLQLAKADNPRRILKGGNSPFGYLYNLFHVVLPSAKFFLCAALEMPVLRVLSLSDFYLDVGSDKTAMRFKQEESIRSIYADEMEFRKAVRYRLANLTNAFIESLHENIYSFPKPLSLLVNQISKLLTSSCRYKEANVLVTELIFTWYICPAILDPEQHGICDSLTNEISRHNLIQIGQIIQMLALSKSEASDAKALDFYDLLNKNAIHTFIEEVLNSDEEFSYVPNSPLRRNFLFKEEELYNFIYFLQKVSRDHIDANAANREMTFPNIEEHLASLNLPSSVDNSPKHNKPHRNGVTDHPAKKSNFLSIVTKNDSSKPNGNDDSCSVLVFPVRMETEFIGLLPENKFMNMKTSAEAVKVQVPSSIGVMNNGPDRKQMYNNYLDEGSIGNTSDNLEAISEAASNHSVASSLELENDQNDNLSDMVSANVSGRGTPNISGRDTPSSQVNENDDRALPEARQADVSQPQPQMNKQIRSEIDDKFCKFEIKKLLEGDETISIISETWSTDVLASDNETVDATDSRNERHSAPAVEQTINENSGLNILLDISETQSESAWSTDVMTSDTERLTEVDNDDTGSVAQSDDAHSIAPSDETRSETDENSTAPNSRRLSNTSNSYASHVSSSPSYASASGFQELKKVEMKTDKHSAKLEKIILLTDNNANMTVKSYTVYDSQQISHNSVEHTANISSHHISNSDIQDAFLSEFTSNNKNTDVKELAGSSGLNKKSLTAPDLESTVSVKFTKQSNVKYDDSSADILLSNSSLNSNSSGSSSTSFENKISNAEQWENKHWSNSSGSSLNVTSTPSESTSELSVLSVNNFISPGKDIPKKPITLSSSKSVKPSASTGAIPKSISFDMSADKGDDEQRIKRGSFFGKIRMGFRNRRGKSLRSSDDSHLESHEFASSNHKGLPDGKSNNTDFLDDILAKYRTKSFVESTTTKRSCCDENKANSASNRSSCETNTANNDEEILNPVGDVKRKLRLVLCNTSLEVPDYMNNTQMSVKNKLEFLLRLELARMKTLRNWSVISQITEALRCITSFDDNSCLIILQSLREDLKKRSTYINYLINSRQELLYRMSYLDSICEQIKRDQQQCDEYMVLLSVNKFLGEQESLVTEFCSEFKQLDLADEKCDSLHHFYSKLYSLMNRSSLWQEIYRHNRKLVRLTIEQYIMSKVYINALYPNGDGDRDRDSVLHQHIQKLSAVITPSHKYLMINSAYLSEFPWTSAQEALKVMSAYKTPRDKLNCVIKCAKFVMDLLSFAQCGSTTADDFTPILVFVMIKANPPHLLSTIQFVNSYYSNQLMGEEQYWWTQFCAAVEFIKTMDYAD